MKLSRRIPNKTPKGKMQSLLTLAFASVFALGLTSANVAEAADKKGFIDHFSVGGSLSQGLSPEQQAQLAAQSKRRTFFSVVLADKRYHRKFKMSCWAKKGARRAVWSKDVRKPIPFGQEAVTKGFSCPGFVHISIAEPGKWHTIAKLDPCTGKDDKMRFAWVYFDEGDEHDPHLAKVAQHCLGRINHTFLPDPPNVFNLLGGVHPAY